MLQTAERRLEGIFGNHPVTALGGKDGNSRAKFSEAVLAPVVIFSFERRIGERFPLEVTRAIKGRERLSSYEREVIERVAYTDWSKTALTLSNYDDRELAAQATALGAVLCYGFGNFYAVASHPCDEAVMYVNRSKGRPEKQVGSLTTVEELIPNIFDWTKIPEKVGRGRIIGLMDAFYQKGPFGFRGPVADGIHSLLSTRDGDVTTTQIIAPGYDCPSNILIRRILAITGENSIFITSANLSHSVTGTAEEPAHYKMSGIQKDFGKKPGYIMIAHKDEDLATQAYEEYLPMSTSIIGFQNVVVDEKGRATLSLERIGSLDEPLVKKIAREHKFSLERGSRAKTRLPLRTYPG